MNANGRMLGIGFEESTCLCQDEGKAIPSTKRQMETGTTRPSGSPTDSCEAPNTGPSQTCITEKESFLGAGIDQSLESASSQSAESLRERDLGICNEEQDSRNSSSKAIDVTRIALRPVQVKELVNNAGFGKILSERQLFRYRKEMPEMVTGDGGINLIRFIAALCRQRTRSKNNKNDSHLPLRELLELLEAQDYRCALTGQTLNPDDIAVDHIVPISRGGDFSIKNSQLVSKSANRAKHTMSQLEFLELCRSVSENQRSNRVRNS